MELFPPGNIKIYIYFNFGKKTVMFTILKSLACFQSEYGEDTNLIQGN